MEVHALNGSARLCWHLGFQAYLQPMERHADTWRDRDYPVLYALAAIRTVMARTITGA